MTAVPALDVAGVTKTFGGRRPLRANDGVSLTVPEGAVVGLLGHNGAGKTTLVNQVAGLLLPDSGSLRVVGHDVVAHPERTRREISVQAQANVPITGLTPRTAIELVGRIRGGARRDVARRTEGLIEALDLGQWASTPAHKVSGGVARLTAFAMTAVVPGRLVILDEPTNDVDPVRRRLLWTQIKALADDGAGVLLVTHNVREAEHAVDDLVILDRGRVIAHGTVAELTRHGPPGRTVAWPPCATETGHDGLRARASVPAARAAEAVAWAQDAVDRGDLDRYSVTPASLEDVYVELVGAAGETSTHAPVPAGHDADTTEGTLR
jgi:ABC-2 type transport system ATP-binding protein